MIATFLRSSRRAMGGVHSRRATMPMWASRTTSSSHGPRPRPPAAPSRGPTRGCEMPRRTPSRRALGQNFFHDQSVVAEVIGTLHPPPGALVLDLGAGAGALTAAAAARGSRVLAVELDPRYARVLRMRAPELGRCRGDRRRCAAGAVPRRTLPPRLQCALRDRHQARAARARRGARAGPRRRRAPARDRAAARRRRALRRVLGVVVRAARPWPHPRARVPAFAERSNRQS